MQRNFEKIDNDLYEELTLSKKALEESKKHRDQISTDNSSFKHAIALQMDEKESSKTLMKEYEVKKKKIMGFQIIYALKLENDLIGLIGLNVFSKK